MKRILTFVSMILLATTLFANPVSREKALRVAEKVFNSSPATKGAIQSNLKIVWDGEFEQTKGVMDPDFYVVAREGKGFVIVAGNDNVQPVLGFSFDSPFKTEGMPEHVRAWMGQMKSYVQSAVKPLPGVREKWADLAETKSALSGTFEDEYTASRTLCWDQSEPFNYYAPTVTGQSSQAVTGCVPLAIAEIMTWHWANNPAKGTGTVEEYSYTPQTGGTQVIPEHTLGTVYDWSGFKACNTWEDFYTAYPTMTDLGKNVAQLIYDIGTILQVEYNNSKTGEGSGTGGNLALLNRLVTMMSYNKGAYTANRTSFTVAKWEQKFINEITLRPVYYSGMGHAYVADGYATYSGDTVVHFNLGWGGHCNGYYYYYDVNTDEGEYTGSTALFDFYPDPLGTSEFITELSFFYDPSTEKGGLVEQESEYPGYTRFDYSNLKNSGSTQFDGFTAIFRVNKDGTKDATPLYEENWSSTDFQPGWYFSGYNFFSTPSDLTFGDKYIMFYKKDASSEYIPVRYEVDGNVSPEIPVFPAAFIKTAASYNVGDYFVFELTNNNYRYGDSTWKVTNPAGVTTNYTMNDWRVKLTIAGEYKIEASTPSKEKIVVYITVNP